MAWWEGGIANKDAGWVKDMEGVARQGVECWIQHWWGVVMGVVMGSFLIIRVPLLCRGIYKSDMAFSLFHRRVLRLLIRLNLVEFKPLYLDDALANYMASCKKAFPEFRPDIQDPITPSNQIARIEIYPITSGARYLFIMQYTRNGPLRYYQGPI